MRLLAYLRHIGCEIISEGGRWVTNSPIKAKRGEPDRTPSFVIFKDGKFKDWSTGCYGDLDDLRRILGDSANLPQLPEYEIVTTTTPKPQVHWRNTIPEKYLDITEDEREKILNYGRSRRITEGFIPGCFFRPDYSKRLAMIFVHQIDGQISGAKFRAIDSLSGERRFVMRGKSGFYELRCTGTIPSEPALYLVESETSSNSLWMICRETNRNAIVLSHGSVQNIPRSIPYSELAERFLILDQDGDEKLYQSRLQKYEHLELKPIRLSLNKGVDINSLYARNETFLIESLI